jgi:4'-phosphopantetheinyl transferase
MMGTDQGQRILHIRSAIAERNLSPASAFTGELSGAHLWYAPLPLLLPRLGSFRPLLDTEEHARAQRFLHDTDRERFILGHGLLRELLGRYVGRLPEELVLQRGEFGKPFIKGHPVHFNLSDTKDAILVGIARLPIGADIETMNRKTDHERVAEHYFTLRETRSIAEAPDGKRRFLELWTRKEAVLKACGIGLMDDLKSLDVGDADNTMAITHADFLRLAAPEYHVHTMPVGKDHLISMATPRPVTEIQLFQASPL